MVLAILFINVKYASNDHIGLVNLSIKANISHADPETPASDLGKACKTDDCSITIVGVGTYYGHYRHCGFSENPKSTCMADCAQGCDAL